MKQLLPAITYLSKAVEYIAQGDYDNAIACYQTIIDDKPEDYKEGCESLYYHIGQTSFDKYKALKSDPTYLALIASQATEQGRCEYNIEAMNWVKIEALKEAITNYSLACSYKEQRLRDIEEFSHSNTLDTKTREQIQASLPQALSEIIAVSLLVARCYKDEHELTKDTLMNITSKESLEGFIDSITNVGKMISKYHKECSSNKAETDQNMMQLQNYIAQFKELQNDPLWQKEEVSNIMNLVEDISKNISCMGTDSIEEV